MPGHITCSLIGTLEVLISEHQDNYIKQCVLHAPLAAKASPHSYVWSTLSWLKVEAANRLRYVMGVLRDVFLS